MEENSVKFSKGGNHYILVVVMKRKFTEQWLTVLPILTKRNNHLWPQIIERKKTMTYDVWNPGTGTKSDRVTPVGWDRPQTLFGGDLPTTIQILALQFFI